MKSFTIGLALLWAFLLLVCPGSAETTDAPAMTRGSAVKGDELKAEPFRDAKTVGTLSKGDVVEILDKDGPWLNVRSSEGTSGWVRMLSIRRNQPNKPGYTPEGILALASGRAGTGKVVATTGIRGLNEETLKAAQFSAEQVTLLESFRISSFQARKFAAEGKLKAKAMAYLSQEGSR